MSLLERETVIRVRSALVDAGLEDSVIELSNTARSAADAASPRAETHCFHGGAGTRKRTFLA